MKMPADCIKSVKEICVIEVKSLRGSGVEFDDMIREVTQYWSTDGKLLAENDPVHEKAICAECGGIEDYPGQHIHSINP